MKIRRRGSSPSGGCIQRGWAPGVVGFSAAGPPEDSVRLASKDPAGHSSSLKQRQGDILYSSGVPWRVSPFRRLPLPGCRMEPAW